MIVWVHEGRAAARSRSRRLIITTRLGAFRLTWIETPRSQFVRRGERSILRGDGRPRATGTALSLVPRGPEPAESPGKGAPWHLQRTCGSAATTGAWTRLIRARPRGPPRA